MNPGAWMSEKVSDLLRAQGSDPTVAVDQPVVTPQTETGKQIVATAVGAAQSGITQRTVTPAGTGGAALDIAALLGGASATSSAWTDAQTWLAQQIGGVHEDSRNELIDDFAFAGNYPDEASLQEVDPDKTAEMYRLLVLAGSLSFADYKRLKKADRLGQVTPELVAAVEHAMSRAEAVRMEDDLLGFLQAEAEGTDLSDLAPPAPPPPDPVALRQTARGVMQDLTGVAPRDEVAGVADEFSMKQAQAGLSAQGQFQEHIEQTQGGAVMATRVDNAVNVLREMVGL